MKSASKRLVVKLLAVLFALQFVVIVNDRVLQFGFCDDNVLSVEFEGRLGNVLFQLASAYGIAKRNEMTATLPYADPDTSRLKSLFAGLEQLPSSPYQRSLQQVRFDAWGTFELGAFNLPSKRCVLLKGFLQSYKYFAHCQYQIRQLLRFNDAIVNESRRFIEKLTANHRNKVTIGVHVRRGDYATQAKQNYGYTLPDADYFRRAMKHFRESHVNAVFVVISEDLAWCQDSITGADVVYGSAGSSATDLCVLSMLDHMILSVGTFSWWAGYLNRGEKVYFRDIARRDSSYSRGLNLDDFFPKEWVPL